MPFFKVSLFLLIIFCPFLSQANENSIYSILKDIQILEEKNDPKCYATASRLEDFMYGTPLTETARFYKNNWQKQMVIQIWVSATQQNNKQSTTLSEQLISQAFNKWVSFEQSLNENWLLKFSVTTAKTVDILAVDVRQYGSIAYSLRALLAVQQDNLELTELAPEAVNSFKKKLDLLTLALIQIADKHTRKENRYQLTISDLQYAEKQLGLLINKNNISPTEKSKNKPLLLLGIIKQKIASYKKYNDINNQLFIRNLQVYFARLSWPKDKQQAKDLKNTFIDLVSEFALKLYQGVTQLAVKNKHPVINEADVTTFAANIAPHIINDYEDAIFFPNLEKTQQINIEAYDMDAFRDSGLHWKYLEFALSSKQLPTLFDANPFAAEIISENIAQYAVLLLRIAGNIGIKAGDERLQATHLQQAQLKIQSLSTLNNQPQSTKQPAQLLASSDLQLKTDNFFADVTEEVGINSMHRSSDWLNRLLRSYLKKDSSTGIITIPPAFGGSGIAAEDINNDGFIDILILSGLGNKLYLNDGKGKFIDITQSSGISWKRTEDKHPGEPRQPLINDFDNDGWQDIAITYVNDDMRIYKNMGNGKFQDMSQIAKLGGKNSVAGPATVFDYDNDGLLDIYISYFGDYIHGVLPTLKRRNHNGIANKLFKNMGNFKFKDVTAEAGVGDTGWGQALTHTDINADGWQDLIVGNDFGVNVYYINNRNGTFTDYASKLGTDKPSYTMNTSVADLNRDQLPDIYISNIVTMNKDEKYVLPNENTQMKFNSDKLAKMRVVEANDLFLSYTNKQGKIRYQHSDAVGRGYSSTGWSWDADFFDADLDGDDDLYVVNGMNEFNLYSSKNPYYTDPKDNEKKNVYIPVSTKESNVFFLNHGGKLKNLSHQSGLDLLGNSRSAAYFDFDNDGDLDIILNNYHAKAVVFQNSARQRIGNNWIKIRVLGDPDKGTSRDAIGARIVVTSNQKHQIWREVHSSTGYLSVHPKIQHFGLGKALNANIKVVWPNGKIQTIKDVPTNNSYIIDQKNNMLSPR
ncbi:MAG: CRTAC1 family protein [Pseudomonadota bacterium]